MLRSKLLADEVVALISFFGVGLLVPKKLIIEPCGRAGVARGDGEWASSYDSGLRIFDKRNIRRPLINKSVGGGIWRLKWHEVEAEKLLLATMHDGFKVVELIEEEEEAQARTGEPGTASESERPMTPVEGHDPIESKDRTKSDSSDDRSHRYSQLKLHSIFRHRSNLAYGVDWGLINYYPPSSSSSSSIPSRPTRVRNTLVGSCSFYDRAMHFWSVDGS